MCFGGLAAFGKEISYVYSHCLQLMFMCLKDLQIPDGEQVNVLIQQCNAADDPRLQVKCIGTLECLAQTPSAVEANQV